MRRLFLFACYDAEGRLTPTTDYLLSALKRCGDVVMVMDAPFAPDVRERIKGRVLYAEGLRHEEYDFGSYKRAFQWAEDNLRLSDYDILYLVNDSVFGPLGDLSAALEKMEALDSEVVGRVYNPHRRTPHLQTWFVGLRPAVFLSQYFRDFMLGVAKCESKHEVCVRYEIGLTRLLNEHGITPAALFQIPAKKIYNSPKRNLLSGLPFVKKDSLYRHGGSLGRQIKWLLDHGDSAIRQAVIDELQQKGREDLLTDSRFTVMGRYLRYLYGKI